jgi:predicted RNase H-related nuclease YkuK (DUF458 family)
MEEDLITSKITEINKKLEVFNDPKFVFVAETHKYTRGKIKFTSVTTKIAEFVEKFDSEKKSREMAFNQLMNESTCEDLYDFDKEIDEKDILRVQEEILLKWKTEADNSCVLGTAVHLWMEEFFGDTTFSEITDNEVQARIDKFKKFYDKKLHNKIISVGQEIRVFNTKMKIAGTIDALFIRISNGKLLLEIWDYKTNKKICTDDNKRYKKLLAPFNDQYENELNKYSIQLNIYKLILASAGILIDGELVIVHVPNIGDPVIYRCKDYIKKLEMYFGVNYYSKLLKSSNQ